MTRGISQTVENALEQHYRKHLGKLVARDELADPDDDTYEFEVLEFEKPEKRVWLYATIGVSSHRPCEFIVPAAHRDFETGVAVLGAAYDVARESDEGVHPGHTIQLAEPLTSDLGRLLVGRPWAENDSFETLTVDNELIRIFMVVPIFESEFALLRRNGEDQLWLAFANEKVDFSDFQRKPLRSSAGMAITSQSTLKQ